MEKANGMIQIDNLNKLRDRIYADAVAHGLWEHSGGQCAYLAGAKLILGEAFELLEEAYRLDLYLRMDGISTEDGSYRWHAFMMELADVIELLVGALRDALDKPMQKPLTLEEFEKAKVVWIECSDEDVGNPVPVLTDGISDKIAHFLTDNGIRADGRIDQYGSMWRAWASKPTDEERSAAAWES